MTRPRIALAALAVFLASRPAPAEDQSPPPKGHLAVTVRAGAHPRQDTPVRFELPESRFGPAVLQALEAGPATLAVFHYPEGKENAEGNWIIRSVAQADRSAEKGLIRLTWIWRGPVPARAEDRIFLGVEAPAGSPGVAWTFAEHPAGALELKRGDRPVFRYNAAPVSSPDHGPIQTRDAYIHPAYSPSGALVTGDFSPYHPHHRGFFLAYVHTRAGASTPDFWNFQSGTGKIHSEGFDKPVAGPVTARFSARHRWEAKDKATGKGRVVLRERWDVEAFAVRDSPYWLFDLTSTQEAVGEPLELIPHRYGGMAYRGPEPFVKGPLDVLTAEGRHRFDGDQKPTRWVDLAGPVADGSGPYAGAMIADHPTNLRHPNVARIHPVTLPFFSFVPAHSRPLSLPAGAPTVFRYRVLIHDGHPDADLDERTWRDFAEPPTAAIEPTPG